MTGERVRHNPQCEICRNKHRQVISLTIGSVDFYKDRDPSDPRTWRCDGASVTFTSNGQILIEYDDDAREASQRFSIPFDALDALYRWVLREHTIRAGDHE